MTSLHSTSEIRRPVRFRPRYRGLLLGKKTGSYLVAYFRSGWAFLIPYLATYLLYAWLKWPVNAGGARSTEQEVGSWIPCLLHVYWILHGLHLVMGGLTLRTWWRNRLPPVLRSPELAESGEVGPSSPAAQPQDELRRRYRDSIAEAGWRFAPWLGLALLFWIPGVYMEFPADPWQHYARVNEWSWHESVTQHSYWKKSSYFLAYSFIGRISPPLLQLKWFDVYYTGCCLLLCWQYYRLARAIGFSERASLIFVLLQTLLFGNNIFGFYRYYGMSSTLFAQLGAVALTRIVLEAMRASKEQDAKGNLPLSSLLPAPSLLLPASASALALLLLTAFNHAQGLGLAALGITAIAVWRLIEWRRAMIAWLAFAAIVLSIATVLWYPRHPLLDSVYRPNGWLTSWYGFNLIEPNSPGFQRAWVVPGLLGAVNLFAGLWLLRRNRIEGWLTVTPALLLLLPCVAIPFATSLANVSHIGGMGYIIVFHRMLFAMPAGLAICTLFQGNKATSPSASLIASNELGPPPSSSLQPQFPLAGLAFSAILLALVLLATMPAGSPTYNRLYNVFMVPAADLKMQPIIANFTPLKDRPYPAPKLTTSQGLSYVAHAIGIREVWHPYKLTSHPPSYVVQASIWQFRESWKRHEEAIAYFPFAKALFSAASPNASLSGHWNPREVSLQSLAGPAIEVALNIPRPKIQAAESGTWYYLLPQEDIIQPTETNF